MPETKQAAEREQDDRREIDHERDKPVLQDLAATPEQADEVRGGPMRCTDRNGC